ncbi:L-serine ammonia-lyase, iron-sulfur-dependent, subunit alpha [Faecalicatena contorta]|uniref:L-serine ammonia-lyase, iron-sulfur-dependent, subunit alpha n=1 Tax=Faecalicatena contorta TaxID=39482 RepID=UPI0031DEC41E
MEEYYGSIFNEVFGPVMIGTSSSHTAGPYRIGAVARMLLGDEVKRARISFDPGSSYASYYKLQWSDRGFTAGLIGGRIDSDDMTDALEIAKEKGVDIQFVKEPKENKHANYALMEMEGKNGRCLTLGTTSVGGGAIEVIEIDGFPIQIKGDFNAAFLYLDDTAHRGTVEEGLKAITEQEFRVKESASDRKRMLYFETREALKETQLQKMLDLPGVADVRYTDHVLPVLSSFAYEDIPFRTAAQALEFGKEENMSAGELGIRYEMARSGYTREKVMEMMQNIVGVMRRSAHVAIHNKTNEKIGELYPVKATDMYESMQNKTVPVAELGILNELVCVAIGILEKVEQKRPDVVVASPTVGSVGILPAAVVHLGDRMGKSDEEIAKAMFAAGCVGIFVAHQATFGGEVAGCQAECGSAGAMAAAGVAEMLGGSAQQAFTASAVTLQNVLGLICDPVSVGYEPCNARNAMAVSNALSSANMVLCGFSVQIPLDETIIAMKEVGEQLPPCLKGTYGGLACTPTGQKIAEICEGE